MKYLFFGGERDFSDVIKYVHNKQASTFIQLNEVDSVKNLCKMRDGVLFSDPSKRDIQIIDWCNLYYLVS